MTRTALLSSLLLAAACKTPAPAPPLGDTTPLGQKHVASARKIAPPVAPPDPTRPFRLAFANPGGMWMPQQMVMPSMIELFGKLGVQLPAQQLADPLAAPLAAVVNLSGCTGSFVSPQGLIVTNHHCAQSALQLNSDPAHNYVEDGFTAATLADEKPAGPANRVRVAQAFTDVTSRIRDGLEDIADPVKRKDELDNREKALVAACEKDRPDVRCSVSSFFHGGQYELIEMLELKDLRLVYAPPRQVGDYGGEKENWEWPRHTGDWSYFRAYVGKDGKSAEPSPDNVPYQPKHWLHVTTSGVHRGDFVMVAGYPGSTSRTQTAADIHFDIESRYPAEIETLSQRYKVAEEGITKGGDTAIKATTSKQRSQNFLEKYQGILQGFQRNPALLAQKDALDKKAKAWAAQDGREDYAQAIEKLEAIEAAERKTFRADHLRQDVFGASTLLRTALSLVHWADERTKPDAERRPGYQDRDLDRARAGQKQLARQFDAFLDRGQLRVALVSALALPPAQRPWLAALLDAKPSAKLDELTIDKALQAWYEDTGFLDEKLRIELLEKGTLKQLAASKDPFIRAALRIWPTAKAEEKKADARAGELLLVQPRYVEALRQALGGALAPDANGTLRVTFGTVRGLHPESDAQADAPFTGVSQILQVNTGSGEFDAPKKELAAITAKQFGTYGDPALGGDIPLDFESDLDTTNGNSGSPTMNGKGELVGVAFDGTKEGLASDAVFDPATTRAITVDARYMIWSMDLLDGAQRLVTEMGLVPQFVAPKK